MKHVLLATTALTMSAGFASAEMSFSFSGKANAGSTNTTTTTAAVAATSSSGLVVAHATTGAATAVADAAGSQAAGRLILAGTDGTDAVAASSTEASRLSSGIDLNFSASVTTDSGVTLTVSDDFGGGELIDWNDDYALEAQTSDLDQPTVKIAMGTTSLTIDPDSLDDLYDDSQSGDAQISATFGSLSLDYVMSNDTDDDGNAEGTTSTGTNSYAVGYSMGDISLSLKGTDSGDAGENEAMKWKATYGGLGNITLGIEMNNNGDLEDTTKGIVTYAMGNGLSVTVSADDNDDWDASATWAMGAMSVSYSTDENSAYEANASYDMGGGAKVFAATTDANDYTAVGVEFSF